MHKTAWIWARTSVKPLTLISGSSEITCVKHIQYFIWKLSLFSLSYLEDKSMVAILQALNFEKYLWIQSYPSSFDKSNLGMKMLLSETFSKFKLMTHALILYFTNSYFIYFRNTLLSIHFDKKVYLYGDKSRCFHGRYTVTW